MAGCIEGEGPWCLLLKGVYFGQIEDTFKSASPAVSHSIISPFLQLFPILCLGIGGRGVPLDIGQLQFLLEPSLDEL